MEFRPFLNSDSPGIAAVWNSQPPLRARFVGMTPAILEQYVFSKPFFDPRGLIVAVEGDELVGFVHSGFSPGEKTNALNLKEGIIFQLMVKPVAAALARTLLNQAESFLQAQGARELIGGSVGICAPYYLGLYGGSSLPGILDSDESLIGLFREAGYIERDRRLIFQRELASFRPPVDRQFLQLRRQYKVAPTSELPTHKWNQVCAWMWLERTDFAVESTPGGKLCATLSFWDVQPLASIWGSRAIGLLEVTLDGNELPAAETACFLGEALRQFQSDGYSLAEIQLGESDAVLLEACRRLGFTEVERGTQFGKVIAT